MKHKDAVELWNECCQLFFEQSAATTHLGVAAIVLGVPISLRTITDYALANPASCPFPENTSVADFLRRWADAIDRKGEE